MLPAAIGSNCLRGDTTLGRVRSLRRRTIPEPPIFPRQGQYSSLPVVWSKGSTLPVSWRQPPYRPLCLPLLSRREFFPARYGTPTALRLLACTCGRCPPRMSFLRVLRRQCPIANFWALRILRVVIKSTVCSRIPTTLLRVLPKHLRFIQEIPRRPRPGTSR